MSIYTVIKSTDIEYLRLYYKRKYFKTSKELLKDLKVRNNNCKLTDEEKKSIDAVWRKYTKTIDYNWALLYKQCTGVFSPYYIPSDIYFGRVCRFLNQLNEFGWPNLQDKNYLDLIFSNINRPYTIVRNINNQLLDNEYQPISLQQAIQMCLKEPEIVIKPSVDSTCGKNIEVISCGNDYKDNILKSIKSHKRDFVVQKVLKQHPDMARLNPDSINGIRVLTLLWKNKVTILGALARIGTPGIRVDNPASSNGVSCAIDLDKGSFYGTAYDRECNALNILPNGIVLKDYSIPSFKKILDIVIELHYKVPHSKLIGWDFAIGEEGEIILVEANMDVPEIYFHQLPTGPLFGESDLFNEVMDSVYGLKDFEN